MADAGTSSAVRTTCPYCGVGCGVLARVRPDGTVDVTGDPEHPANLGRLCSKGAALADTLGLDGRLLHPQVNGQRTGWDAAIGLVAQQFRDTIATHGPDSVAFYVSGQLLTEDYYVANKLMKGFIGSGNIDTNSRLCMASSVAGHRRAFGADIVPVSYEDMEQADLVVLTGSNMAWCHPVLFQRLLAARDARPGMKIVVIDPRRTATAEQADLHLQIRPGGDVALFAGLLRWLQDTGCRDQTFTDRHTSGLDDAIQSIGKISTAVVADRTGLPELSVRAFYGLFAAHEKTVTVYSQGVNQATDGTDRVNAIINCHLLTGRIGRAGMGPFSITGQPNAMGGREVGGLANQLAAHMEIDNPDHRALVQDFWQSPRMAGGAGLKAVDMFDAIADGQIKAVWIMATNPVVSMPDADRVRDALRACPFVVVSDAETHTDTADLAHVLLPAAAWGEKDGTVTNSERRISRQRNFLPLPGQARPDWRIICDVAIAMGFANSFDYPSAAGIFDEHARLSAAGNNGTRDFDIGGLGGMDHQAYDRMSPVWWPASGAGETPTPRFFADGRFFTGDRRARFIATPVRPVKENAADTFVLNSGRVRDQWHTMTRTGRSPRLSQHLAEPFVELHPRDARRLGIGPAELVRLTRGNNRLIARALVTDAQQPGSVFSPMHWTAQGSAAARIDALIDARPDPVSGQPALKSAIVHAQRQPVDWYGFGVSIAKPAMAHLTYWAATRAGSGFRFECAGLGHLPDAETAIRLLALPDGDAAEVLQYVDNRQGIYRIALFRQHRLIGALFCAVAPVAVAREWLVGELGKNHADVAARGRLLAGRPKGDQPGPGAMVCSCNNVGANTIAAAIADGAVTVAAVGACTEAGTGCGSCQGEITRMLNHVQIAEAV